MATTPPTTPTTNKWIWRYWNCSMCLDLILFVAFFAQRRRRENKRRKKKKFLLSKSVDCFLFFFCFKSVIVIKQYLVRGDVAPTVTEIFIRFVWNEEAKEKLFFFFSLKIEFSCTHYSLTYDSYLFVQEDLLIFVFIFGRHQLGSM